ncbi:MAG: hypothetical protein ACJ75J_08830, partial [Cytophagaceae bacterium]
MMTPPANANVIDWPSSILWFDEDGILYSVSKKVPPQSMEEVKKTMEDFYKLLDGKKVCMLVDVTHSQETSRELRDYAAQEFPKFTKAIAMVSESALGKMLANLFF